MKKKIYYLMLLLCMSLLPMRVYALESDMNDNDNQNIVGNENEIGNENNLGDGNNLGNENNLGNGNDLGNENNLENNEQGNENEENPPMAVVTYPEVFVINDASFDLVANENPSFTATIPEDARYALVTEYWGNAWDTLFYSSDSDYNANLLENYALIDPFTFGEFYYYHVTLSFYGEGAVNEEDFSNYPFVLNGEETVGTLDECNYNEDEHLVYVSYILYETTPAEGEIQDIESLEIHNLNLNVTEGQAPLYGASIVDENVDLLTEMWYASEYDHENDTWYVHYKDSSYLEEHETLFDTFQPQYRYNFALFLLPKTGYALKINNDAEGQKLFSASINGAEQKQYDLFKYYKDNNFAFYILYGIDDIVPISDTYNVVENGDSTINKSDGVGLTLRTDGNHELFFGVYVDGLFVTAETAIDDNGKSIIRFADYYIQSLEVGEHTIAISYKDGKNAYTNLTIVDNPVEEETEEVYSLVSNNVTSNYIAPLSTSVLRESKEEPKKETTTENKEKEENKDETNIGLWIGLILLGLIAIGIPIAVYKKDE